MQDWEREREARLTEIAAAFEPLRRELEDAGIDASDFGRFVGRIVPGIIGPSRFDQEGAVPLLLKWLPRIEDRDVRSAIVAHLATPAARSMAVPDLITEFHRSDDPEYKWEVAMTLQYVCTRDHFPQILALASDPSHGIGRAPLIAMLWRVKTAEADQVIISSLDEPGAARDAMSALRRRFGNAQARPLIEPLRSHPEPWVTEAAKDHLKRIDKSLAKS